MPTTRGHHRWRPRHYRQTTAEMEAEEVRWAARRDGQTRPPRRLRSPLQHRQPRPLTTTGDGRLEIRPSSNNNKPRRPRAKRQRPPTPGTCRPATTTTTSRQATPSTTRPRPDQPRRRQTRTRCLHVHGLEKECS